MKPLISVVVPVYNVENELSECIESIIFQSYQNLEILLVDDGATDKSGAICDEYADKDSRISVFHKKNGGISDARNYGISRCNGTYILCVDSDDILRNTHIETLFSLVSKYNAEMAICTYQKFHESSQLFEESIVETGVVSPAEALEHLLYQSRVFHTGANCKLYHRELFKNVAYPKGLICEDLATTYKLMIKTKRIAFTTEKLYGYRIRPKSLMRQEFSPLKMSCIPVSQQLYNDITHDFPQLINAVSSRAFSCNRAVYLQIPSKMKKERDAVWQEMKKYRGTVIKDKKARKSERIIALLSYLGQTILGLFSYLYRRQQMSLK